MTINSETPGLFPISIDGTGYLADLSQDGILTESVPMLSPYFSDQGARPGEQSLNKADLWRRSVESGHHGAGQSRADGPDSDPFRFRTSLHVDPWTKYELNRLPALGFTARDSSAGQLALAGNRLYWMSDDRLAFTSNLLANGGGVFTTVTGAPANFRSMTSDGHNIYTTHLVNDIYRTDPSSSALTSYVTNSTKFLDLIRYVKGRLVVFDTLGGVYNPVAAGALPAALFTHPLGADWSWQDATSGVSNIYMIGTSGFGTSSAQGVIYRCAVKPDGTALDVPIIAGRLPDGESARAILGYLGLLFVGTTLGVRVCQEQSDGSVVIGPLIDMGPESCLCFEPQGSQVWFGIDVFEYEDGTFYTGLGRIDLSEFPLDNGTAAYASDLMSTTVDYAHRVAVTAVATYQDRRVFTTGFGFGSAYRGLYVERTDESEVTGHIASGEFGFDLTENKTFHLLKVRSDDVVIATTTPSFLNTGPTQIGADSVTTFDLANVTAERLEYQLAFNGTVKRVSVLARPAVGSRLETITIPLVMTSSVVIGGQERSFNVADEVAKFRRLIRTGTPVTVQEGADFYSVVVEDYRWQRKQVSDDNLYWYGVLTLQGKRFDILTAPYLTSGTYTQASGTAFPAVPPEMQGVISGDIIVLGLSWTSPAVAAPTAPTGWTQVAAYADTNYGAAVYTRSVGTGIGSDKFAVTFASSVQAVETYAVYRPGTTMGTTTLLGTVHSASTASLAYTAQTVVDPSAVIAVVFANGQTPHGPFRQRAVASSPNVYASVTDATVTGDTVPTGVVTFDTACEARVVLLGVGTA